MKIVTKVEGDRASVELKSSLVGSGTDDFCAAIGQVIEQECFHIVLDFGSVTMIDSRGLEALLDAQEKCKRLGGGVKIVHAPKKVKTIFKITRLEKELSIA